jgi:hypothetical protein
MVDLGDSFMLRKPRHDVEHLWILLTKPDPITQQVIMVNITTERSHSSDKTTVLVEGDHPFIKKPSVVFYADASVIDVRLIEQAISSGVSRTHAKFSSRVLAQIQAGIQTSPMTPKKIKVAYAAAVEAGLVE